MSNRQIKKRISVLSVDGSKYPDAQLRTYEIDFLSPALRIKAPDMDAAIEHFSNMPQFKNKDVEIIKMRAERRIGVLAKYTDFSMDAIMMAMVQSQTLSDKVRELEQELQAAREVFENQSTELHVCQGRLDQVLRDAARGFKLSDAEPIEGDDRDFKALYRAETEQRAILERQLLALQAGINSSSTGEEFARLRSKLEKRSEQAHRLHDANKDLHAKLASRDREIAELRSMVQHESLKRTEAQGELKGLRKSLEMITLARGGPPADVEALLEAERMRRMELEVQLRLLNESSATLTKSTIISSGETPTQGFGDDEDDQHGDLSPNISVSKLSHASFSASESSFRLDTDRSGSTSFGHGFFGACNTCECGLFKSDPMTTWICVSCGHFSINHRSSSSGNGSSLRDL
eukprot:TRINITY_DN656_c0_g1_i1.p1 TRINITY_DN656_c0_g1~~TRINITY_DN656_c0_g1_i1.p1  ORF type:complete len:405 (+),score=96.15 TRINITY_DN656_c0_g1_i1:185-1399(+)